MGLDRRGSPGGGHGRPWRGPPAPGAGAAAPSASSPAVEPRARFGALLREWRRARGLSQLRLALKAGISCRHLCYLENTRANPSREMVVVLAAALDLPPRERNALSLAAGYAPQYRESDLNAAEMEGVHRAIRFTLAQQEPYPAFVVNRYWDVVMANDAAVRIFGHLRGSRTETVNVMRDVFAPGGLRRIIANWEEVGSELIRHLHDDVAAAPQEGRLRALLEEILACPGLPAHWRRRDPAAPLMPVLTAVYRHQRGTLRFFSTIATFGTRRDVTLDELRIECAFPADSDTARFCRALAAEGG